MKILEILNKWNKPGSKYVSDTDGSGKRTRTNQIMGQCKVMLEGGQIVTRHLDISKM